MDIGSAALVGAGLMAQSYSEAQSAKIRLEQDKLLNPAERLRRDQAETDHKLQRKNEIEVHKLQAALIDWSNMRCSPITHRSWANEAEVKIMTSAYEAFPENAHYLPNVFAGQRSTCGTNEQFHAIYRWMLHSQKLRDGRK